MNKSLTEEKVLDALGVPDFRHMTKDKVVGFVSMLPQMDPEVTRLALEQFPAFAETTLAVIQCMKDSLTSLIDANNQSMARYYDSCQSALSALQDVLAQEALSDESRRIVIVGIVGILDSMGQKDTENKEHLDNMSDKICTIVVIVLVCLVTPLGIKFVRHLKL